MWARRVLMMSVMKLNVRQLEMKENGSPALWQQGRC